MSYLTIFVTCEYLFYNSEQYRKVGGRPWLFTLSYDLSTLIFNEENYYGNSLSKVMDLLDESKALKFYVLSVLKLQSKYGWMMDSYVLVSKFPFIYTCMMYLLIPVNYRLFYTSINFK